MMGSLRGRHLLNVIAIIVIAILALGALLSFSIYQDRTKTVGKELERTALDLLGYIEYDKGQFLIAKSNQPSSEAFLHERNLLTSSKERFAYIWDVTEQKVIWDSLDNNNVNLGQVANNFALFDFDALVKSTEGKEKAFNPAVAQEMNSVPTSVDEKPMPYMVAAQKFVVKMGDEKRSYLFVVATTMASITTESDRLVKTLMILLIITAILLLIAQLIFNRWIVSPLRKFEQEVLDVEKGKKVALEHDYPSELQSIQKTINALIQRKR